MATDDPILDALNREALRPQSMSGDGVTSTRRSLTDLIEAEKYTAGAKALARPGFGIMRQVYRPGSAMGDQCR